MFGKLMYYDKKTVDEYRSIVDGKRHCEIDEYEISNDKGAGFDIKVASVDTKANKKYTARVVESMLYDCYEFERKLIGRDDYFDFTQSAGLDLTTVPRGSIVKIDAFIEIPEDFDIMRVIDTFKPMLMNSIDTAPMEQTGKEALEYYLSKAKATKIPIIVDTDNMLLCSKLSQDKMISEYEEFEEIDEKVTILARISSSVVDAEKPFFDPLRDFITMNRMMRRNMKDRGEGLTPLLAGNVYRQIDVLAVYR